MASHPATTYRAPADPDSAAFAKVAAVLLGLTLAVVGFFALMMWADARDEGESAAPSAGAPAAAHDHATDHNTALPLNRRSTATARRARSSMSVRARRSR